MVTKWGDDGSATPADFEPLFVDEPAMRDPVADLRRGRRLRRRRRLLSGVVGVAAVVTVGGVVGVAADGTGTAGPVAVPSASPSSSQHATIPDPSPDPTATPTAGGTTPGDGESTGPSRDTAPSLRRDARGNYLDADGRRLGGSLREQDPDAHPFHVTTRNSWRLAVRHLDPSRDHLGSYEAFAFTGGSSGAGGLEVGQKLSWSVRGDRGEGMVQLAVTRLDPGTTSRLGHPDAAGFCNDLYVPAGTCRRTTVAGVEVYLGKTPDGGFVMDRLQGDGEVASIIVSPVFGNNTTVSLRSLDITPAAAAALLNDRDLDVIG